jgi:FtsP/CotA-like multicopper oxidase with cupredoxin domain
MDRQRRKILGWGLSTMGLLGGVTACRSLGFPSADPSAGRNSPMPVSIPPLHLNPAAQDRIKTSGLDPMAVLRDFDYGKVSQEDGRTVREFHLTAQTKTIKLDATTEFIAWNVNNRVPGPTLRATAGDRVRIAFANQAGHAHSLHFHGEHRHQVHRSTSRN